MSIFRVAKETRWQETLPERLERETLVPHPAMIAERLTGRESSYVPSLKVLNAILYVTRSGCAWRLLPHDAFPC